MVGSRERGMFPLLLFCVLLILLGATANAQQVFGSIYGTVTDPTGAAVSGAKVTIAETTKGTDFDVTTNESGNYTKGQLIPGIYRVTIEATGFQKVVSNTIQIQVDQAARFDAALTVGNVSEQVEVSAAAPLLQSDRADVAQTFSSEQISELPNIGRNLQSFELLNPGTIKMPWQHATDENPQGSVQTMVNGQLFSATGYELDGTTNQDPILGIIVVNPTIDSIGEVKQSNQDFDAEFSYAGGGLMAYSTKSGSNQFHGDVFEYLGDNTPGFSDFGRNPFSEPNGAPTFHQNQFGGAIGGPIIKNKLFFFGDAQLNRESLGGSVLTTVPTLQERIGNFSDFPQPIYDPTTGNPTTGQGRTQFPGNQIPSNMQSAQALAIMKFFPNPDVSGAGYLNNYTSSGSASLTANQWNTREDYYLNDRNTIFGRYSYAGYTESAPGAFGLAAGGPAFSANRYAGSSNSLNQSVAIGWTRTQSPTLINEFRFGYMRYHVGDVPNGYGTQPALDAGIPGLNLDKTYTSGLPGFFINEPGGTGNIQLGYALGINGCNCPLTETERQYQFIDNVSKIMGNHTLKFGADIRYALNLRVPSDAHRAGELSFDPGLTGFVDANGGNTGGSGLATFLLGDVTYFKRYVSTSTDAQEHQKRFFWYGQDTWRVTPKLTLNLGLRWEMIFPETVNADGNGAEADLSTGLMDVFGVGNISNHGYQDMNWHNFAPRVGVAYQIDPKTVVRSGYGWSYNQATFGTTFGHNVTQNPPVLSIQQINQPNNYSAVFTLAQGPSSPPTVQVGSDGTFPIPDGIEVKTRPKVFTMPVVYMYNVALQRQVTDKISVTASYVGNQTRHGILGTNQSFNANEAFYIPGNTNNNLGKPFYQKYGWTQTIDNYCDCANGRYDSFQALFTIRNLAGYTLQGNYTYQISQGNGWGPYDSTYYFLYDRDAGWGNSDNIPHQQWVFTQSYDFPFGHGKKWGASVSKPVDYLLGGWSISGITTYYSGVPFSPTLEHYPGQPSTGPNNRPNEGSGDPYSGSQHNRNQWFVGGIGGAFLEPGSQTFGNYPINTLYGPHFINQDISLFKSFALSERYSFTVRMDSTNAFNHTNLGTPNNDVQAGNAGQITSTAFGGQYLMRRLQFSATLKF